MTKTIEQIYGPDPFVLFGDWFEEAEASEPVDHNAMSLATVGPDGKPAVRIVLLKGHDERGFTFFTNYNSEKGRALIANPRAELCFYWKSLGRQVRISGPVEQITPADSEAYFNSRPRASRIGAWASSQSEGIESYEAFQERIAAREAEFEGVADIPRPPHWGGFRLTPQRMEFWIGEEFRVHKRFVYTSTGQGQWKTGWLCP